MSRDKRTLEEEATSAEPKARRTTCNYCKSKKIGCRGGQPEVHKCDKCQRQNVNCVYGMKDKPGPRLGQKMAKNADRLASISSREGTHSSEKRENSEDISAGQGWLLGKSETPVGIDLLLTSSPTQPEGELSSASAALISAGNSLWNFDDYSSGSDYDYSSDEFVAEVETAVDNINNP